MSNHNDRPAVTIRAVLFTNSRGLVPFVGLSPSTALDGAIADYCRRNWDELRAEEPALSATPPSDDIAAYLSFREAFEGAKPDRHIYELTTPLHGALSVLALVALPSGELAGERRTVIAEFLAENEVGIGENADLASLVYRAMNDDLSMSILGEFTEPVDGATLATLARAQGSDPEFFGLTEDGSPVDGAAAACAERPNAT
jgi:hypothetical protein